MNKTWLSTGTCLILALCGTNAANAAETDGISTSGEAVVEANPERMRLKMELSFKGKDLPEALSKWKARQPELEKQLLALGAIKESIKLSDPLVDQSQHQDQAQISRMMNRMSGRRGRRPAEDLPKGASVKVRADLTVEWPLKFTDRADLLVQVAKRQEAIKAADLGGLKSSDEDGSEEEEMTDEMEAMQQMYGNQNRPKPGEPVFLFVAKVPPANREQALTGAFRDARAQALQLAKAADVELGPVRTLSTQVAYGMDEDDNESFGYRQLYNRDKKSGDEDEASSLTPTILKRRFYVQAVFAMNPKLVLRGPVETSKP